MPKLVPAVSLTALQPGEIMPIQVGGFFLCLYLVDGQPYCLEDFCTHEGLPISSGGWVEGDEVQCPWHGARFNVKTGDVVAAPAEYSLRSFPVQVRDGFVYIDVS